MKKCCSCKKSKPKTEFNKNKTNKDGIQTKCRECSKRMYREHKERHPTYYTDKNKRYRKKVRSFLLDYLMAHHCVDCKEYENKSSEVKISLTEENLHALMSGEIVENGSVKISLQKIGWQMMAKALYEARQKKDPPCATCSSWCGGKCDN